jgi:hypothetical protein
MKRAATCLGVRELTASGVSPDRAARPERAERARERTIAAGRVTLEEAGVPFADGGGPGARLRRRDDGKMGSFGWIKISL